jgi:hypothetical protein
MRARFERGSDRCGRGCTAYRMLVRSSHAAHYAQLRLPRDRWAAWVTSHKGSDKGSVRDTKNSAHADQAQGPNQPRHYDWRTIGMAPPTPVGRATNPDDALDRPFVDADPRDLTDDPRLVRRSVSGLAFGPHSPFDLAPISSTGRRSSGVERASVGARTEQEPRPARRCPMARIGWRPGSPRTRRRPPPASSLAGTK